jgi:L,D-transpeptidase ErfK/SrfK
MRKLLLLLGVFCSLHATALTLDMPSPGEDIVGEVTTVTVGSYNDTINTYAEAYGLGFRQLVAANPGVNPWVPGEGTELVLPLQFILPPGERTGIVINLAEMRMYHYQPDGRTVETYPIGIGREGWETPLVAGAKVLNVIKDPTWVPPPSIRADHLAMGHRLPAVVPPGPDNPMGPWAVQLSTRGYYIHGTNKELGIGMRVSAGCIRMYNKDVEEFARRVAKGTPVRIVNAPVKVGWKRGELYVEVHEALEEQRAVHVPEADVADAIHLARRLSSAPVEINWLDAKAAALRKSGMPVRVSADDSASIASSR